ncbi:hypothetical protein LCGC14_1388310 [marine sediment metagenome]|uniref:Uncharacterized protein n=1 Tax=marine sediment metagenome TaxID=412755 RepID=A0A0F9K0U4_9ZZZZ
MQTANTVGPFSWNIDTSGIPQYPFRSWQVWVRLRLRRTEGSFDFLSAGFYINAPQQGSRNFFTGIRSGLFAWTWDLGRYLPLTRYVDFPPTG